MKRYALIIMLMSFLGISQLKAQMVFSDVTTATMLYTNGMFIGRDIGKSNNRYGDIAETQKKIMAQMAIIDNTHKKVLNGLSQVSYLLNDAITVKNIFQVSTDIKNHISSITSFIGNNPQYSLFAGKSLSIANTRINGIMADFSGILTSGETNLMNAGKRKEFLNGLYYDLMILRASLYGIIFSMESAKRIGFWKALNPFQGYIDQDKAIMQDIIRKSSWL